MTDYIHSARQASIFNVSKRKHHAIYTAPTWSGDSGAALVLKNGKVVGIHVEGVNAAKELIAQKESVDERLTDVELSLASLVKSTATGAVALLSTAFRDAVMNT